MAWHVFDQSADWLMSWKAARLATRIALNQAVLETAQLVLRGRSLWPAVVFHLFIDLPILP